MTPIRLGIIGTGGFSESPHRAVVEAQPDRYQISAIYDPSPGRGLQWATRSRAAAFNSLNDLLTHRELEAVFIGSSSSTARFEAAQAALDRGLHVVLDRPMAASAAQCDQLIQRARRKGVTLTAAHLRRWDHQMTHALSRIASGEIGDPLAVKLAGALPEEGGLLFSESLDLLDAAQLFNKSELQEVSAAPNAKREGELDVVTALFRFEAPPSVEVSLLPESSSPFPLPRLLAVGTRGSIVDSSPLDAPNAQTFYDLLWKSVRQRTQPPVLASSARNAVYLAECVLESAQRGRAVAAERLLKAVE